MDREQLVKRFEYNEFATWEDVQVFQDRIIDFIEAEIEKAKKDAVIETLNKYILDKLYPIYCSSMIETKDNKAENYRLLGINCSLSAEDYLGWVSDKLKQAQDK